MQPVCLKGIGSETPVFVEDENGEFTAVGKTALSYAYYRGVLQDNGTTTILENQYIGLVSVGNYHTGSLECTVQINNTECCSCESCLDQWGTVEGMKADCSNVPNGGILLECESTSDYFPFDLSLNGASQEECNIDSPLFLGGGLANNGNLDMEETGTVAEETSTAEDTNNQDVEGTNQMGDASTAEEEADSVTSETEAADTNEQVEIGTGEIEDFNTNEEADSETEDPTGNEAQGSDGDEAETATTEEGAAEGATQQSLETSTDAEESDPDSIRENHDTSAADGHQFSIWSAVSTVASFCTLSF